MRGILKSWNVKHLLHSLSGGRTFPRTLKTLCRNVTLAPNIDRPKRIPSYPPRFLRDHGQDLVWICSNTTAKRFSLWLITILDGRNFVVSTTRPAATSSTNWKAFWLSMAFLMLSYPTTALSLPAQNSTTLLQTSASHTSQALLTTPKATEKLKELCKQSKISSRNQRIPTTLFFCTEQAHCTMENHPANSWWGEN